MSQVSSTATREYQEVRSVISDRLIAVLLGNSVVQGKITEEEHAKLTAALTSTSYASIEEGLAKGLIEALGEEGADFGI